MVNVNYLDYEDEHVISYLKALNELSPSFIEPSRNRILTPLGRQFVTQTFVPPDLDYLLRIVKHGRHGNPDMCEMDSFVYEAADVLYQISQDKKRSIEAQASNAHISLFEAHILAGISSLEYAVAQQKLTINPPKRPKDDKLYVGYSRSI